MWKDDDDHFLLYHMNCYYLTSHDAVQSFSFHSFHSSSSSCSSSLSLQRVVAFSWLFFQASTDLLGQKIVQIYVFFFSFLKQHFVSLCEKFDFWITDSHYQIDAVSLCNSAHLSLSSPSPLVLIKPWLTSFEHNDGMHYCTDVYSVP